jgi:hypothetical protein
MTRPTQPPNGLYTAAEAAAILRCSAWWLKKECRQGRAPYTWIGGSYHFTDEHIADIIRRRERRPVGSGVPAVQGQGGSAGAGSNQAGPTRTDRPGRAAIQLQTRIPPRARAAGLSDTSAA